MALVSTAEPAAAWIGDARVYHDITAGLLRFEIEPSLWVWTPGYPLCGALLSFFGGVGPGLLASSLLFGILAPIAMLRIGTSLGRPDEAALAATAFAFAPDLILASARPLSDMTALGLLLGAAWLAIRARSVEGARARRWWALAAGCTGGLALLSRPEYAIAVLVLAGLPSIPHAQARPREGARAGRSAQAKPSLARRFDAPSFALFAAGVSAFVLPYVLGLHAASGVWALSLKGPYTIAQSRIYRAAETYAEKRANWGAYLDRFETPEGKLDPRKVATMASVRENFATGRVLEEWIATARTGIDAWPTKERVIALTATLGLVLPGRDPARLLFVLLSLHVLAVPLFVTPMGRFLLPAAPAIAWGLARLLSAIGRWLAGRSAIAARAFVLGAMGAIAAGGVASSVRLARDSGWQATSPQIEALIGEGNFERAREHLAPFLEKRANDPQVWRTLARLEVGRQDMEAAERAFREALGRGESPIAFASFLIERGRAAEAEALIAPLRQRPPETMEYHLIEGQLAFANGKFDVAVQRFLRAERLAGVSAPFDLNLGVAHLRAGQIEEGLVRLRRAASSSDAIVARRAAAVLEAYSASKTTP